MAHFRKALAASPESAPNHTNLGAALLRTGSVNEAVLHFEKALKINPEFADARFNLASVYYMRGKTYDAVGQWREGLRVEPGRLSVLTQLAWVLATSPKRSRFATAPRPWRWRSRQCGCPKRETRRSSTRWPPPIPRAAAFRRPSKPRARP